MTKTEFSDLLHALAELWSRQDYATAARAFAEDQQIGAAEYTYDGTHRYHGTVLVRVRGREITHWREYQHIDSREWEVFASGTVF